MSAILNNMTKNAQGIYKGGANEVDVGYDTGDVIIVSFAVLKAGEEVPTALGSIQSDPLTAPDEGKKWLWSSRDWIEQGEVIVPPPEE